MSSEAPAADERWQRVRRMLAVRLDNAGDVLMTTPALAAIRQSVPGARLTLLTSSVGAAVAACVREIDEVMSFDAPWAKPHAANGADLGCTTK